jgi:hypothetical protein
VERASLPTRGRSQHDPRENVPSDSSVIRELGDAGAVREKLASPGPQRDELAAAAEQDEPQPVTAEPLRHVAAIHEAQLEEPPRSGPADGEASRVEPSHDPAADVQDDEDADPNANPDPVPPERARRQEDERRVIPGLGAPRQRRANVKRGLRAGRDPDAAWAQPQPCSGATRGAHPRFSAEGAREAGARDVDEQSPAAGIPHCDRRRGSPFEPQAERARAEPDAAAGGGRGTRDGCRGRCKGDSRNRALHPPITVNVSVAE